MGEVVDLTPPGTPLCLPKITLYSLIPGNSALRLRWKLASRWAPGYGTPSASVHSPVLRPLFPKLGPLFQGHGGLMARPLVRSRSLGKRISSACLFYPLPMELSPSQIHLSISP